MTDPILELVALYIERDAMKWMTSPENMHPLSGAIENGAFGTEDERISAVRDDAKGVASMLMQVAAEVRAGHTKRAFNLLRLKARNSSEARKLMVSLDPSAKPWYPDADMHGDPVVPGKRYFWMPGPDNQGNKPGFRCEGVVSRVSPGGMAFAVWEHVGEENPSWWGRGKTEIEGPNETGVPTKMLTPME